MTRPEEVKGAVDTAAERLGRLDVLVNNAGVFLPHPPLSTSYEDWQAAWSQTIDTNLIGAAHATFCQIPHLRSAGGGAGGQRIEPRCVPRRAELPGIMLLNASALTRRRRD